MSSSDSSHGFSTPAVATRTQVDKASNQTASNALLHALINKLTDTVDYTVEIIDNLTSLVMYETKAKWNEAAPFEHELDRVRNFLSIISDVNLELETDGEVHPDTMRKLLLPPV